MRKKGPLTLAEARRACERLVAGEGDRYEHAIEIAWRAMDAFDDDWRFAKLYDLWMELTDHWEDAKDEAGERAAESEMIEAAAGYLAAEHDEAALRRYFDHWHYDRLGFRAPARQSTKGKPQRVPSSSCFRSSPPPSAHTDNKVRK